MNIIVAGAGKVGSTLTRHLTKSGYDVTIIDTNQDRINNVVEEYDVMAIQGNCASMELLIEAGVKQADLLIAVTGEDEVNMLACLTAHGLNENLHTIARIRNPEYTKQAYLMRDSFGLSLAVNPEKQAAVEIEHLLKYPGFLRREPFAQGRVEVVELRIDQDSPLVDIPLSELNNTINCKVLICTVLRDGKVVAPDGRFVLKQDDRIFVTAPTETLTVMLNNLGIITHKVKRVIICGGSRIAFYLTQALTKSGIRVQIVENNAKSSEKLAEFFPKASIIQGDASNQSLLDSEGIDTADALVTLTGLDEQNILISLYGKSQGVPQVITKIGHMDSTNIVESLAIGSLVSPKALCCDTILRYVRAMYNQSGSALSIHEIADGNAEAIEFRVDESTKNCGVALKDLKLKPGILISCIIHGINTTVPDGHSFFMPGDTVIVISTRDDVVYQLNEIFP